VDGDAIAVTLDARAATADDRQTHANQNSMPTPRFLVSLCFFTPIHSEIDLLYYPEKQAMRALSVEITTVSLKKSRAFDATK
jgi:hypothetical protein